MALYQFEDPSAYNPNFYQIEEDESWGELDSDFSSFKPLETKKPVAPPAPSKIAAKYFNVPQKQKDPPRPKPKLPARNLVDDKIEELNKVIEKFRFENEKLKIAKHHYEEALRSHNKQVDEFERSKFVQQEEITKLLEQEQTRLTKEKRIQERNMRMMKNMPNRKERDEIEGLKQQLQGLQDELKVKVNRWRLNKERLEKQLVEVKGKNSQLKADIEGLGGMTNSSLVTTQDMTPTIPEDPDPLPPTTTESHREFDDLDDIELLHEERKPDLSTVRYYESGHQQIIFPQGNRKEIYPNGYTVMYYANGDIKHTFDDRSVYYYQEAAATHIVYHTGLEVIRFGNGQIEKHYENGQKKITYPDGSVKKISCDGNEVLVYPDGQVYKLMNNGIKEVLHPGGHVDVIYPNGRKLRKFHNGKTKELE